MKQLGQAASTMDVASGLLDHCRPCSFYDDRQAVSRTPWSRPFEELLLLLWLILGLSAHIKMVD
jgi:hypothetical protein